MIRSFKNRALHAFWHKGDASGIRSEQIGHIRRRLVMLAAACKPEDMNIPEFNFHRLRGKPVRYAIHVSGPWCITFEWDGEDAVRVELEQYH